MKLNRPQGSLGQQDIEAMLLDWERRDPLWGGFTADRTHRLLLTALWAAKNAEDAAKYRKLRRQNSAAQKRWRTKRKAKEA